MKVLFIEPFYGGSHKQLIDLLIKNVADKELITLSAKKWPWRARCSALILSDLIPCVTNESVLFCSSVLNLAELLGIRPDLNRLKKIVYFHENQFVYPVQIIKERDIQYAYNQITTCLAADVILFNSEFNKESLLKNLAKIIKLLPDYRPKNLQSKFESKCRVLYFPVYYPQLSHENKTMNCLHIVWPHRWEFDKDPETFLECLIKLHKNNSVFKIHFLGGNFEEVPKIFGTAKSILKDSIQTYGYVENKEEYFRILKNAHVAVSTAKHEFFGVSMLEATYCGCFPLVPKDLVYPEIYPKECLYSNKDDLYDKLKDYCEIPQKAVDLRKTLEIDFDKYSCDTLMPLYLELFE